MDQRMDEPILSLRDIWQRRLLRLRAGLRKLAPFVAGMAAAFLAIALYSLLLPPPRPLNLNDVNAAIQSAMASATPPPSYSETVYQIIQPSLVLIQAKTTNSDGKEENSLGTGTIINDAGDILTSLHVVANSTSIQVTFADGTQSAAQIILQQPEIDIAELHADTLPAQVVPAVLGNPNAMRIGDEAYAVGNPFGLYSSMSAGVISGFNRTFESPELNQKLTGLIQIDTAVNPGNSGGPLLNRAGQVIGVVEGIVNPTGQDVFIGIGFAVPITTAGGAIGSPPD
jgi:S1-C subfamily serine protease